MSITETRINLVGLVCSGCDCGTCVTKAVAEIGHLQGVCHVRVDRRTTQVVVRYDDRDLGRDRFVDVITSKGIELRG